MNTGSLRMINRIWLFIFFCAFSCQDKSRQADIAPESNNDAARIANYFDEVKALLAKDNGNFWGKNIYGPSMIVDRKTRKIWANQNSKSNWLKADGRIFTGSLSEEYTIANKAIDWDGERWSMIMVPLPTTSPERNALIIHESFHREQPALGFKTMIEGDNSHLDTKVGRIYLKLELEALKKALFAEDPGGILHYVQHALWFRKIRHERFAKAFEAESKLEINEGLAEYTGIMLCGRTRKEQIIHLDNVIDQFYNNSTFIRSFAYHTIPAYGFLLSQIKSKWHLQITHDTKLTDFMSEAFKVDYPESLAQKIEMIRSSYNYTLIESEEIIREKKIMEIINAYKQRLLADSFLVIPLVNMNISFDPNNILAIGEAGTVYPNITVIDNWGKLEANNGALISNNWDRMNVSKPVSITDSLVSGDGWSLKLNKQWRVEHEAVSYKLEKN